MFTINFKDEEQPKYDCCALLDEILFDYGTKYDGIINTGDFNFNLLANSRKVRKFRSKSTHFPNSRNSSLLDIIVFYNVIKSGLKEVFFANECCDHF